jgi:hypothetical protein
LEFEYSLVLGAWNLELYVAVMQQRSDGRAPDQIRPVHFELDIAPHASGSVLVSMGNTRVICGVMIEETVPRWMKEQIVTGGWLTAEYSMLPEIDRTIFARRCRSGKTWAAHNVGGLRRLAG